MRIDSVRRFLDPFVLRPLAAAAVAPVDRFEPSDAVSSRGPHTDLQGTVRVNGSDNPVMAPDKPTRWDFSFVDRRTGQPVTEFEPDHEKPMHLFIISQDMATFAHIHPLLKGKGVFEMGINQRNPDPDSQDAIHAVPRPGDYLVFTEVKPKGRQVQTNAFNITATGTPEPAAITVDPYDPRTGVVKYFNRLGQPGNPGDAYRTSLTVDNKRMLGFIHVNLKVQQLEGTEYVDVHDLQPWMGMAGHAVLVSEAGAKAEDKVFEHLHAGHAGHPSPPTVLTMDANTGPNLLFMMHGSAMPPPGVHKVWVQFKHHDNIYTCPFVLDLK